MIFPRPTIKIGKCIAILQTHYRGKGLPILHKRPIVRFNKESWIASRLSYHLNRKKILRSPASGSKGKGGVLIWKSKQILHTCNHIWCIEPSHLYDGGHKENGIDRWNDASKEYRDAFKKKMKKICSDPTYRANMVKATKGIPKSDDWKRKASIAAKNRAPPNKITRAKMSDSAKRRCSSISKKEMSKRMSYVSSFNHV